MPKDKRTDFIKNNFKIAKLIFENTLDSEAMIKAFANRIRVDVGYSYKTSDEYILGRLRPIYERVKEASQCLESKI